MAEFLHGIAATTTTPLTWTWVPRGFLQKQGFRSLAETTQATLEFHHSRGPERRAWLRAGAGAREEAAVLRAWQGAVRGRSSAG